MLKRDWQTLRRSLAPSLLAVVLWLTWAFLSERDVMIAYLLVLATVVALSISIGGIADWLRALLKARNELLEIQGRAKIERLQERFEQLMNE